MKTRVLLLAAASLITMGGMATAADHLLNAEQHGLSGKDPGHVFSANPAGRGGDVAPGRGSPFLFGDPEDAGIPSTDTPQAHKGQTLPSTAGPK